MGTSIFFLVLFWIALVFHNEQIWLLKSVNKTVYFKPFTQTVHSETTCAFSVSGQTSAACQAAPAVGSKAKWDKDNAQTPKSTRTWEPAQQGHSSRSAAPDPGTKLKGQSWTDLPIRETAQLSGNIPATSPTPVLGVTQKESAPTLKTPKSYTY